MYRTKTITRYDEEVAIDGCCFVNDDDDDDDDDGGGGGGGGKNGTSNGHEDVKNETHL